MKTLNKIILTIAILVTQANLAMAEDIQAENENVQTVEMQNMTSQIKTLKMNEQVMREISIRFANGKSFKLLDVQNLKKPTGLTNLSDGGGWQPELSELNGQNSVALEAVRLFASQSCNAEFIFTNLEKVISDSATLNISHLPADIKQCLVK